MNTSISKLTIWRFEKQGMNINKFVQSHYEYEEVLKLLEKYDIEDTVCDTYDDEQDSENCTWQDYNYVGNLASDQEELNESFQKDINYINEYIKSSGINADDYFYVYKDDYQIVLYFALRETLKDYLFVFANKNRVVFTRDFYRLSDKLSYAVEEAVEHNSVLFFNETVETLLSQGLLKSCGTMAEYGVVFAFENVFWTDSSRNIYQPLITFDNGLRVVGSVTPDKYSNDNTSMFKAENRYKTRL